MTKMKIRKCLLVLFAVLIFVGPPSFAADNGKIAQWIETAKNGPICNEGSIQLAHNGVESLPALEAWYAGAGNQVYDKISSILSLMLLYKIQYDDLKHYEGLNRIAEKQYAVIQPCTEALKQYFKDRTGYSAGGPTMDGGDRPSSANVVCQSLVPADVFKDRFYSGFVVRHARELIDTNYPYAKWYGAKTLFGLGAISQLARLQALRNDPDEVSITYDDYTPTQTIGQTISTGLGTAELFHSITKPDPKTSYAYYEAGSYVSWLCSDPSRTDSTVENAVNRKAQTYKVQSWDEFWSKAGPILEQTYREVYPASQKDLTTQHDK